MDDLRRWDTADVLEGVDELLNSGAATGQEAYSLEEILKSMDEVAFYDSGKVAAPRSKKIQVAAPTEKKEAAAEKPEEAVQEQEVQPVEDTFPQQDEELAEAEAKEEAEAAEGETKKEHRSLKALFRETIEGLDELVNHTSEKGEEALRNGEILFADTLDEVEGMPTEESSGEMEEAPVEEMPTEEESSGELEEAPVEGMPTEESSGEMEEAPVAEEAVEETADAFSLDAIMKEYSSTPAEQEEARYSLDEIMREFGGDGDAVETLQEEAVPQETADPQLDLEEMAAFIGQNVSTAMGQEDEAVEKESDDSAPEKKVGRLKKLFHADAKKSERREEAVRETAEESISSDTRRVGDIFKKSKEESDSENIAQMPTPKMKLFRDSFGKLQDKMDDFADNMYDEALTEEDDLENSAIPETDIEQIPPQRKPKSGKKKGEGRLKRLRKPAAKAEDIPAEELTRRYKLGLGFMSRRLLYVGIMMLVSVYLSAASETKLPLPFVLEYPRVCGAILTWLLGMSCAAGLDVLWLGMTAPFRGRTGMHTLTAAAVLAALADGIYFTVVGREGPLPLCAVGIAGIFCSMLGVLWRKRTLYHSCQSVARCNQPGRVTLDADKWNGKPAFIKQKGDSAGFGSQIQGMDGANRMYRSIVPVVGVLAVLGALAGVLVHGEPSLMTWALSAVLCACAPLSGLLAFAHPYDKLSRRLDHSGAVLAGWEGAASMGGKASIIFTDADLFPEGSTIQRSVAQAEGVPLEKITACVASILYEAKSGLYNLFDSELRRQGGSYRPVQNLQVYEAGGFSADIRGEEVLVGSYGFLDVMGVSVPEGQRVRSAVYCAINKKLSGIFFLDYSMLRNDKLAVRNLVRSGINPVLATRDFNIIPTMLLSLFDLPVERMEYPRLDRRRELSDPEQEHNPVLGAILTRDNIAAYADVVMGGRRLNHIVKLNAVIAIMASLVGLLLGIFLVWNLAFDSLTPLSMLLFLLIWAVPNVAISGAADKF